MSDAYRGRTRLAQSRIDPDAYLATRAPATFAAIGHVIGELAQRHPSFAPQSLIDMGAGPGTASWATLDRYPQIAEVTLIENTRAMIAAGARLATDAPWPALVNARWLKGDARTMPFQAGDLGIAAYVLNELEVASACKLALRLFEATQVCVFVEPGSRAGFARLRDVRTALIAANATILAPCTHNNACPMAGDDWCHFSQRVTRSARHRTVKGATLGHEDEKFSYLIAAHAPLSVHLNSRIIRRPMMRKGHVHLDLCRAEGISRITLSRRNGADYARARDAQWGDLWDDQN